MIKTLRLIASYSIAPMVFLASIHVCGANQFDGWQLIDPGGGGFITSVAVHPQNDQILYATTNISGAKKSINGGKTWEQLPLPDSEYEEYGPGVQYIQEHLVISPKRPDVILFSIKRGVIYSSPDAGKTWDRYDLFKNGQGGRLCPFTFDPDDADIVYTAIGDIHHGLLGKGEMKRHFRRNRNVTPVVARNVIVQGRYNPNTRKWVWQEVYREEFRANEEFVNIYSIGIRRIENRKELIFVTNQGLYRGQIQLNGKLLLTELPRPAGLPPYHFFSGGKIVFDHRNGHAYLTIISYKMEGKNNRSKVQTQHSGIYRSKDWGQTWEMLNENAERGLFPRRIYYDIAIHPDRPETIYITMLATGRRRSKNLRRGKRGKSRSEAVAYGGGALLRSTNGGDSWENLTTYHDPHDPGFNFLFSWVDYSLNRPINRAGKSIPSMRYVAVGKRRVYFSASNGMLFGCNIDGGEKYWRNLLSTNETADGGWKTTGFQAIAIPQSIAIDPVDHERIYIPYGDHALFYSNNGGETLHVLANNNTVGSHYSGYIEVDRYDRNILYFATRGPHMALESGAVLKGRILSPATNPREPFNQNWTFIGASSKKATRMEKRSHNGLTRGAMTSLLVEYLGNNQRNLYVTKYSDQNEHITETEGVYLLRDGNPIWEQIAKIRHPKCIVQADNFKVLYVGTRETGQLWQISRLGSSKWDPMLLFDGRKHSARINNINDIALCEIGGQRYIYMATDVGVFRYQTEGSLLERVWAKRPESSRIEAIEVNPYFQNSMYFASPHYGVHMSYDYGKTWQDITKGIPTRACFFLKLDETTNALYVITRGMGIWKKVFLPTKKQPKKT